MLSGTPFPVPLATTGPAGSLVYSGSMSSYIDEGGEVERYTVDLDPGQKLTVVVRPILIFYQPNVTLSDPSNTTLASASAAAAGQDVVLQTIGTAAGGTFTVSVSAVGASYGDYSLQLIVDAATESESHNGPANDTSATAQDINSSFLSLGGSSSRGAVLGHAVSNGNDCYSFTLAAGDNVSLGVSPLATGSFGMRLFDPSGNEMAEGVAGSANLDKAISELAVASSGTYSVQIIGGVAADYSLIVLRNATFDFENNHTVATAQPVYDLSSAIPQQVLGTLANTPGITALTATNVGAWDSTGAHSTNGTTNTYIAGIDGTKTYRDFVVFSLASVTQPILSATLELINPTEGYSSADPSETLSLFDVSTAIATLRSSGSGQIAIYNDLGSGVNFGQQTILSSSNNFTQYISLNAAALADLNSKLGSQFAMGGALTSLSGTATQRVFGNANGYPATLDIQFAPPPDLYQITAAAGQTLQFATSTPGDNVAGIPLNTVDPKLRLLEANGTPLAADDNSAADGRNAVVQYVTPTAGTYFVEVSAASTGGDYVLRMSANPAVAPPFFITAVSPPDGAIRRFSSNPITFDFNRAVYSPSVTAADILIDGVASASSVTQVDGDSFSFLVPLELGAGLHTFSIAAGSIVDLQQNPVAAFSSSLMLDYTAPRLVAMSVAQNAVVAPGSFSEQVTFGEPMRVSNLSADDVLLHGAALNTNYTPSSLTFDTTGTILTISYSSLPEDSYTLTLLAGTSDGTNFVDVAGNELDGEFSGALPSGNGTRGGNFVANFSLDYSTVPFATPLTTRNPNGSLIYDKTIGGYINATSDTDTFTISLDAGQTLTAIVHPSGATIGVGATIRDSSNSVLLNGSGAVGADVVLQTVPISAAGSYSVSVTDLIEIYLNTKNRIIKLHV